MNSKKRKLEDFGGVLKRLKNDNKVAAFSSCVISQETIKFLSSKINIDNLLFHFCDFKDVDFSILKNSNITLISVIHGNFSNDHLEQLLSFRSSVSVKLHDTRVSPNNIKNILLRTSTVKFIQ